VLCVASTHLQSMAWDGRQCCGRFNQQPVDLCRDQAPLRGVARSRQHEVRLVNSWQPQWQCVRACVHACVHEQNMRVNVSACCLLGWRFAHDVYTFIPLLGYTPNLHANNICVLSAFTWSMEPGVGPLGLVHAVVPGAVHRHV
jgi:hypothetical protein